MAIRGIGRAFAGRENSGGTVSPAARAVVVALLGLWVGFVSEGCRSEPIETTLSGLAMGTSYRVRIPGADPSSRRTEKLHAAVAGLLADIEGHMSLFDPDSEVVRFNQSLSTDWIAVSPDTAETVALALEVWRATDGAFDITVAPLVDLWGFGPGPEPVAIPAEHNVLEALRKVGFERLEVRRSPPAIRKSDPRLSLDLGGIAKGFGVDRIAVLLESERVRGYLVELGGEIRTAGLNDGGAPWEVGIAAPPGSALEKIVLLRDASVATSGDYRNAVVAGGRRYSHLIEPKTGHPAATSTASVTVVDRGCARADALATALAVLEPDEALALAERNNWPAYFILRTESGWASRMTSAFAAWLKPGHRAEIRTNGEGKS